MNNKKSAVKGEGGSSKLKIDSAMELRFPINSGEK
jgi:hypothetical protein